MRPRSREMRPTWLPEDELPPRLAWRFHMHGLGRGRYWLGFEQFTDRAEFFCESGGQRDETALDAVEPLSDCVAKGDKFCFDPSNAEEQLGVFGANKRRSICAVEVNLFGLKIVFPESLEHFLRSLFRSDLESLVGVSRSAVVGQVHLDHLVRAPGALCAHLGRATLRNAGHVEGVGCARLPAVDHALAGETGLD